MIKKELKNDLTSRIVYLLKRPTPLSLEKAAVILQTFIQANLGESASNTPQEYEQYLKGKRIKNKREIVDFFRLIEEVKYAERQVTREEVTKALNFILTLITACEVQPDEQSKTFFQKVFKR